MNNIENTTPIDVLADRVWSGTKWHYPNIEKLIARITALEAKLTAALATVEKCKQAGFVDERGEVRKVAHNATLPITADGYIAVYGETYFYWDTVNSYHDPIKYGWTERELESCPPHDAEYSWTTDPSLCYYDRAAAAAAKGGGE